MKSIHHSDSLEFLKTCDDYEFDINYSDPPYGFGSNVIIKKDGHVDYKNAKDFMNKWKMPTGEYWDDWFKEAFRTLKHGGYCIMFSIDRCCLLFKYYAIKAGFIENQSMYWYFISNMPKASDLSKNIDKHFGAEREIVGKKIGRGAKLVSDMRGGNFMSSIAAGIDCSNITAPSNEIAQKYNGYKYSIAPTKQTNETILIFQKPYKTKSCLHDTLAFESGDSECCCGAINIDGNRVGIELVVNGGGDLSKRSVYSGGIKRDNSTITQNIGRFPAQTFIDSDTAKILDKQSGDLKGGGSVSEHEKNLQSDIQFAPSKHNGFDGFDDNGGCSKILHKCDYEKGELDLYLYESKVSAFERNAGCDKLKLHKSARMPMRSNDIESDSIANDGTKTHRQTTYYNNHPTLKPISLNYRILNHFKTPNKQKIIFPFSGAGSEIIGGLKAGFTDYKASEISEDYITIANNRIEYWTSVGFELDKSKHEEKQRDNKTQNIDDLF